MKTHLLLVSLVGILAFGCTPMNPPGNRMVAPIAPESQCDAGSQKCNMIITLDVKKKTVISVEKDEDTKKEKVQPEKKLKLNSIEVDADFATILFTHASPGCAYYFYGGQCWYICS